MKNMLLAALFTAFSASCAHAQSGKINFDSIPKNTITIAPFNELLFGTYNNLFYKRKLVSSGNSQFYLRFGLGFSNRFKQEMENSSDMEDRRGYNFKLGAEWNRKLGDFSLSFGPELSYTRLRFGESVEYSIAEAAVFSPSTFEVNRRAVAEDARFRMTSLNAFVGIKYHISPYFQIGIESAIGVGYFRLENDFDNRVTATLDDTFTGRVRELAVGRQLVLECNF